MISSRSIIGEDDRGMVRAVAIEVDGSPQQRLRVATWP